MRSTSGNSLDENSPPSGGSAGGSRAAVASGPLTLVRSLSWRYAWVLAAVAILVLVDQAVIQPRLVRLAFFAPAINVAGRQRMLSQNITKQSLALQVQPDDAAQRRVMLQRAVEAWTEAHEGLLHGSAALGLEPARDPQVRAALVALEPRLQAIRDAALRIAAADDSLPATAEKPQGELTTILAEEPLYLAGMERVVAMLEAAAQRQVAFLRMCGVAATLTIFALLVGMYFAVLRPALGLIRGQIVDLSDSESRHRRLAELLAEARDELETRVEQRTSELLAANQALEREIAERQQVEHRMRDLSAELARASRVTALGQLATGLAHEINQPLASITNYADVLELSLERGSLDVPESRSTVAQLKQAALRAGRIVRRMRNFLRPAGDRQVVADLNELVREVCELCRPQLEQAHVRLSPKLDETTILVQAEPLEFQQVLVNLVQNAAQALAATERTQREIQIQSRLEGDQAVVEVADNGPGFGSGAEDAFAPFYSTKADGLGMGLSISRTIVERYRGRLWGENRSSGGAVVRFTLPLANTHEPESSSLADSLCR